MKVLNPYPLTRALLFVILGIIAAEYTRLPEHPLTLSGLALLGFLIGWFWILGKGTEYAWHFVPGVAIALLFFMVGFLRYRGEIPAVYADNPRETLWCCTVKSVSTSFPDRSKWVCQVCDSTGCSVYNVLFTVSHDSGYIAPLPGDRFLYHGRFRIPNYPVNPGGFDYNRYLKRQQISATCYARLNQLIILPRPVPLNIYRQAVTIRRSLLQVLERYAPRDSFYAIAAALILGYDDDLDPESRRAFASAGAMHILCVSGLHVGIIFLILDFLLGFIGKKKVFRILRFIFLLAGLWGYALITGLAPSVMRAAVMLTFVITGNEIKRQSSIYNSISASALLLLIFNPFLLFAIGFQLSYAAVLAIIALYKPVSGWIVPKSLLLRKMWDITIVSIAAQAGTFALAAYYFHTFPLLFLVTNLIVIPLATVILYSGIALLLASVVPFAARYLALAFYFFVSVLFHAVSKVASIPGAAINTLWLNPVQVLLIILILVLMAWMINSHFRDRLLWVLLPAAALIVSFVVVGAQKSNSQYLVVYADYKNLIVEVTEGRFAFRYNYYPDTVEQVTAASHLKFGIRRVYALHQWEGVSGWSGADGDFVFLCAAGKRIAICRNVHNIPADTYFPVCDIIILYGVQKEETTQLLLSHASEAVVTNNARDFARVIRCRPANERLQYYNTATQGAFLINLHPFYGISTLRSIYTGR